MSRGSEPGAYHLPASHSIRPPFNYSAGHKPVFPHHTPSALRPSFNDEKSAPGGLGICFIIIHLLYIFWAVFSFCHGGVCLCVSGGSLYTARFFIFYLFFYILLSGLKFDVLSLSLLFLYSTPSATAYMWLHLEPQLNTVKAESITKLVQEDGEI